VSTTAQAATGEAPTFPAASLDRRFYAFAIDRLIAWPLLGVAGFAAYHFYFSEDRVGAGIAVVVGAIVLVGGVFAALLGMLGVTPGKALLGLRVVNLGSGTPIGLGRALLRTLILGVAGLPTFGFGLAMLAWTAVMDPGHQRRGWHDKVTGAIVVDVRPVEVEAEQVDQGPRHVVNLTAMRLVPTQQPAPVEAPPRAHRTGTGHTPVPQPTPEHAAVPEAGSRPQGWPSEVETVDRPPEYSPTPSPPPPAPAAPVPPGDDERTRSRHSGATGAPRWRVTFDDGASFAVEGVALVGRRPEPRPGESVQHVVPLQSADMSVSKTHAQFQIAPGGELVVMDRGSTNGSILVRQGMSRELPAGRPATLVPGDVVRFGDRTMTVSREG
jgi:uncharacterized RDD family membrane protein YckC